MLISNPMRFTLAPPAQLDLASGAVTVVEGTSDKIAAGAAYSPDGAQLAVVAEDKKTRVTSVMVAPVRGGRARSLLTLKAAKTTGFGLAWTAENQLVPSVARGATLLDIPPVTLHD